MINTAKNEMTKQVAFVFETDSISKAHISMQSLEMHHVPVMRGNKVVGMISDRDILKHSQVKGSELVVPDKKVSDVLGDKIITCSKDSSIAQVADLMLIHNVHGIPVLGKEDQLVGIITSTDLIRLLRNREWTQSDRIPFLFEKPQSLFSIAC